MQFIHTMNALPITNLINPAHQKRQQPKSSIIYYYFDRLSHNLHLFLIIISAAIFLHLLSTYEFQRFICETELVTRRLKRLIKCKKKDSNEVANINYNYLPYFYGPPFHLDEGCFQPQMGIMLMQFLLP